MRRISLIAASRERIERMKKVILNFFNRAKYPENIEFIISVDFDDPTKEEYWDQFELLRTYAKIDIRLIVNKNKNTVQAINACKAHISGDIIFVISDDTDCFNEWDKSILDVIKDKNNFIVKTSDGIGKDLITMPIFSRDYLDRKGFIYYPEYEHMFCDTDLTCVANLENCIIHAEDLEFTHLYYTKGHHERDWLDQKNQDTFYKGMDLFKKRLLKNFDLNNEDVSGEIPKEIIKFINKK